MNVNLRHSMMRFFFIGAIFSTPLHLNAAEYTLLDAVKKTLKSQPAILIQEQQWETVGGQLQQAAGPFDAAVGASISTTRENTPLSSAQQTSYGYDELKTTKAAYTVEGSKQFRSGISITPSMTAARNDDPTVSTDPIGVGSVSFTVSIPLLQGLGLNESAANELATKSELRAAKLDVYDRVARDVLNTGTAYWTLLAAQQQLELMTESELTAEKTATDYNKLAAADKFPPSDVDLFRANLANITSSRIAAEQEVVTARYSLALAMGMTSMNDETGSVSVQSAFPAPQTNEPPVDTANDLFGMATKNRADLLASREREASQEVRIRGARNMRKPKLDLLLSGGYNGLSEENAASDYYQPLYDNPGELNSSIALRYQFPIANSAAKGNLRIQAAQYEIAVLRTRDLERNIFAAVCMAQSDLLKSIENMAVTEKAVNLYQKAHDSEKKKLLMGISTVIDVVQTEDRLRDSKIRLIQSRQKYASAILRIRFGTGTLINFDKGSERIDIEQLVSAPR
jgi:outer membrane protein TolC